MQNKLQKTVYCGMYIDCLEVKEWIFCVNLRVKHILLLLSQVQTLCNGVPESGFIKMSTPGKNQCLHKT